MSVKPDPYNGTLIPTVGPRQTLGIMLLTAVFHPEENNCTG